MQPALSSVESSSRPLEPGRVLLVDDDADVLQAASLLLGRHGLRVSAARDPAQARSLLAAEPADVVLLDLNFSRGARSGEEGFRCLAELLADDPQAVVVVVTAHSGVSVAVRAMQAGASDFVTKPWNNARLLATVQTALALRRRRTPAAPDRAEGEPMILGDSPAMARVRGLVARAAPTLAPVLVTGEAGSGKSLVARRLHLGSCRSAGPFVSIDFSGLSLDEAERALFGDGPRGVAGALEQARGGSLVLDEVGELAPALQPRWLAALDRAGGEAPRLVSTTRRRRDTLQGRGGLSDALAERLSAVEIALPSMAERGGDALLLAEHFLHAFARRYARPLRAMSPQAADAVLAWPWPGSVRALRQAMERCVIFAEGTVYQVADTGLDRADAASPDPGENGQGAGALNLRSSEKALVSAALKRHGFNVSHAARELGLTRAALYRRMARHGL